MTVTQARHELAKYRAELRELRHRLRKARHDMLDTIAEIAQQR